MASPLVSFRAVSKTFGELTAVDAATLDIFPGEVLAILGENGAGKSTLMKLLFGVYPPSAGEILLDGMASPIAGPADALRHGIGMVFQHFSLLPALSVRDNLLMSWPATPFWISRKNPTANAVMQTLSRLAPGIDPDQKVSALSVGEQQLVELCKALNISARLVILDEPTSVLTPTEISSLHGFIRHLADDGVAVVLITHKLGDVEACADRTAVMRGGKIVDVSVAGHKPMSDIVTLMMGSNVERSLVAPPRPHKRVARLHLDKLCAEAPGSALDALSLTIAAGEVVGLAGVAGNGQTLLAEVLAGIQPLKSGDVVLDGYSIARRNHTDSQTTPMGYMPEQPRENAVVESMTVSANLRLRELAQGANPGSAGVDEVLARFRVNPPEPQRGAATLSGGNLQKLVAARELGEPRPAILACYPTMGLDLSAIEMIYTEIFAQARAGAAVVWISEDLDDLLAAAHRIAVIREGRLVAVLDNDGQLTREGIGALMTGLAVDGAAA